jgi:ATP synthase protein I
MKKDDSDLLRSIGTVGTLGITMVLSTFAGLGIGLLLDMITKARPVFTLVFLFLGIIAGFIYVIYKLRFYGKK